MNLKNIIAAFCFCLVHCISYGQTQLILQAGTEIKLSNSNYIVLENTHFVNNGTINLTSGNGTFKFSGNSNINISGTNKPVFNNLELAKTGSSQLVLQRDIDAWGSILFTSGILHLNNHILDLGKFGSLSNENETSHAIGQAGGYIQWSDVLNAPSNANPGNLGAIITSTQNLGTTTIRRGHQSQTNGVGNGSSILRYYDIIPTNNTGLNATLQINYLDAEINGLPESQFGLWKSSNLTSWLYVGFNSRDASANYVAKAAISDFSRWTISNAGNPLPVKFSVFTTNCNGSVVTIKWTTESESGSDHFEIQKSVDGSRWITVASLPAAGNSSGFKNYSFIDNTSTSNSFYRVAEYDVNGQFIYTPVARANCGTKGEFKLWPNPVYSKAWVSANSIADAKAYLQIIDSKGAVVYFKTAELFAGNNIISIDMQSLPNGNYILQLVTNTGKQSTKLIKR